MKSWKITGLTATIIIILAFPLYYIKEEYRRTPAATGRPEMQSAFVGSRKCEPCHRKAYDNWQGSHHERAMSVADEQSVLGDFENAVFEADGTISRFYRKNGRYFVHTRGEGGQMADFEITHTFGWYPLQQYLVPFPGGRLQCLPIAWDVKEKKWYYLTPDNSPASDDWLYWTNAGQNWNGMCAECHSTNLKKNYDPKKDAYQTTWSDINVGCETCHGPGSRHVEWAEMPDMARPNVENFALTVKTSGIGSRQLVEQCAPCHSRRAALGDYIHDQPDLLDSLLPSLLTESLYFADGQILEEVYVYGSFTQSKMYHREVRCNDCHDVHSLKTSKPGNELCLQCHRAKEYDTRNHHFHKKKGESGDPISSPDGKILYSVGSGAQCVQCHMPGRYYMGIDYRPDHSFRVPRPDLSRTIGTPNACSRCHMDKTAQWADETVRKWYGPGRKLHYGTLLAAARKGGLQDGSHLARLAADPLYPVIVRATALSHLSAYPGKAAERVAMLSLMDDEALIRRTALEVIQIPDREKFVRLITPLLYDPVKAVRMEAARRIAGQDSKLLRPEEQKILQAVLKEFEAAMNYSADFAFGRFNMANLNQSLGRSDQAIQNYLAAIKIDNLFYPAKVNLAMLYNQQGKNDEAEVLLRQVINANPELYEVSYSLGLLLAEMKKYEEALIYLAKASNGMPGHARAHYNFGLMLQYFNRLAEAETALGKALQLDPGNLDFLYAMASNYLKGRQLDKAKAIAEQMVQTHPNNRMGHQILQFIKKNPDR